MRDFSFRAARLISIPLAMVSLVALSAAPVRASYSSSSFADYRARQRDYQLCASSLLQAGIVEADVSAACSAALAPSDIGDCVTQIKDGTTIAATDALGSCRQVRRPIDLASCVVDISNGTQNALPLDILNNCRRSLLPTRFSNCVVGISVETTLDPTVAMQNCIAAGDRPRNVLPSFVPSSEPIPTTPRSPLDLPTSEQTSPQFTPLLPTQPTTP